MMAKFSKDHLCYRFEEGGLLTIGITQKGQDLMGGVQFLEYNDGILTVEGRKTVMDINVGVTKPMQFIEPADYGQPIAGYVLTGEAAPEDVTVELFEEEQP